MRNSGSEMIGRRRMMTALGMAAVGASLRAQPQTGTSVIRTVLDDIRPDSLGTKATLFHEHLSFEWAKVRGTSDGPPGPAKDPAPIGVALTTMSQTAGSLTSVVSTRLG